MPKWGDMTCAKCGKTKKETDFFKMKDGHRFELCKSCLTQNVDNRKPSTFKWILEKFDVPYIEHVWVQLTNQQYKKNPGKFGPASVLGLYIRTMNMSQYKGYGYKDSDFLKNTRIRLQKEAQERRMSVDPDYEERLKEKYDKGEISKAEYDTLTFTNAVQESDSNTHFFEDDIDTDKLEEEEVSAEQEESSEEEEDVLDIEVPNFTADLQQNYENKIVDSLTDEDMQYLLVKWGITYSPNEWVKLEDTYQRYAAEYELNVDREETLKQICKISLKMDKALDVEDYQGYQKLANTFDQLRKSSKFTEAQNKEEQTRDIDSLGELVAFVEREGGAIPQFDDPIDYPQDKVDFTIKDIQNYVNRLVKEDLGLGDLIESYIEKLEQSNSSGSVEDIMNSSFDSAEDVVTEQEAKSFQDFLAEEIENESIRLAEGDFE